MDIKALKKSVSSEIQNSISSFNLLAKRHCLSPIYNSEWEKDNDLYAGLEVLKKYVEESSLKGLQNSQIISEKGKTPAYFFTVDPTATEETYTVLFYGHIDKIPFGTGWEEKKNPEEPVIIDGLYYGRGIANGGYCIFTIIAALKAIQAQPEVGKHPKIAVLIETSKESGSFDLTYHLQNIMKTVSPNLIISLDGEVPGYDYLNYTTSMKGELSFDVKITVLTRGVHSGKNGGLAPDSFLIMQTLLNRIETIQDNKITIPSLDIELSDAEKANAKEFTEIMGDTFYESVPFVHGIKLLETGTENIYINSTFKPVLNIIGQEGMPTVQDCSATIRASTTLRLKFSLPPRKDVNEAQEAIKKLITENPPYQASIEINNYKIIQGCEIPLPEKIKTELNKDVKALFSADTILCSGTRDTYPYVSYLKALFPDVPIVITGVGDMNSSNIRGPNENIHLAFWMKNTNQLAYFISNYENYKN